MDEPQDPTRALVEEVLRTGIMLADVLSGLLDDLPADAFPGEEPAAVLIEMLVGSLRPVTDAAGSQTVAQATALIGAIADRVVSDLRAAMDAAADRR